MVLKVRLIAAVSIRSLIIVANVIAHTEVREFLIRQAQQKGVIPYR